MNYAEAMELIKTGGVTADNGQDVHEAIAGHTHSLNKEAKSHRETKEEFQNKSTDLESKVSELTKTFDNFKTQLATANGKEVNELPNGAVPELLNEVVGRISKLETTANEALQKETKANIMRIASEEVANIGVLDSVRGTFTNEISNFIGKDENGNYTGIGKYEGKSPSDLTQEFFADKQEVLTNKTPAGAGTKTDTAGAKAVPATYADCKTTEERDLFVAKKVNEKIN